MSKCKSMTWTCHPGQKWAYPTQGQTAVLKAIVRENGKKKAQFPWLACGYKYGDNATYVSDGCRIARVFGANVDGIETVDMRTRSDGVHLNVLWNMILNGLGDGEPVTLPTLEQLRADASPTVKIGAAAFCRKYVKDFVKLLKMTSARLLTRRADDGEITSYILQGTNADGSIEYFALSLKNTRANA